jgi:hypothetical protein
MSNAYTVPTPSNVTYQTSNGGMPANVESMTSQYFDNHPMSGIQSSAGAGSSAGEPSGTSASSATTIAQTVVNESQLYVVPSQNLAYSEQMGMIWGATAYQSGSIVNQAPSYITHASIPSAAFGGGGGTVNNITVNPPSYVDQVINTAVGVVGTVVKDTEKLATKAVNAIENTPIGQHIASEFDKEKQDFDNSKVGQALNSGWDTVKTGIENGWHTFESWL